MTTPEISNQEIAKVDDKERNFRQLEARYQRQLEVERQARLELEKRLADSQQKPSDDDDDDEPYVNKKRLANQFSNFERKMEERIEKKSEEKARSLFQQDKHQSWLRQNKDFDEVMTHANKLAALDPDLAESILEMPEGFERQKLVYKNIKALGLHKEPVKEAGIQERIDANRRTPFYQPTNQGNPPQSAGGDFTKTGMKTAYDKMQELKSRLRL